MPAVWRVSCPVKVDSSSWHGASSDALRVSSYLHPRLSRGAVDERLLSTDGRQQRLRSGPSSLHLPSQQDCGQLIVRPFGYGTSLAHEVVLIRMEGTDLLNSLRFEYTENLRSGVEPRAVEQKERFPLDEPFFRHSTVLIRSMMGCLHVVLVRKPACILHAPFWEQDGEYHFEVVMVANVCTVVVSETSV